jgi:hypothetical protein
VSPYRFIEVEKVNHAVRTLCRVLQVSPARHAACPNACATCALPTPTGPQSNTDSHRSTNPHVARLRSCSAGTYGLNEKSTSWSVFSSSKRASMIDVVRSRRQGATISGTGH